EVKEAGRRRRDPITDDLFEDDDLVVTKCDQWHSLESWEYHNFQCVNFPDCQNRAEPCLHGEITQTETYQFFNQQGVFRALNWLWFGSLGGLIAWGLWAGFTNLGFSGFRQLSTILAQAAGLGDFDYIVARDTLMGFSLGFGLTFALSWVEERGQSSQMSWLKIMLRSLLGAVVALLVFLLGFFLYKSLGLHEYLGGLITWLLFGIGLGVVLSIRSTIEITRGLLGGLIAAIVAFNIFYFIGYLFDALEFAKMLSFIVLGGFLGVIVVAVVHNLEDFELEYISPAKYSRVNPISKWLRANMDIYIGSDQGCYVFIKWPDEYVEPRHAKLSFDGQQVFIEPYHEVLVGPRPIPLNKPYALQHNDIIQLGRHSISRMKFIAREAEKE
ncbi:MAG: FHA domain-containing protein, partial [Bacteroidota bacterium]